MYQRVKLYFNEALHKYTDEFNNVYTSATTKLHEFEEPFNRQEWLRKCEKAGQEGRGRYQGMSQKEIDNFWNSTTKSSLDRGNKTHNQLEHEVKLCNGYYKSKKCIVENNKDIVRLLTIDDIMEDHDFGELKIDQFLETDIAKLYPSFAQEVIYYASKGYRLYPELGVYLMEYLLSGLIDLPLINFETKSIVVIDYKTNKHPMLFQAGYHKKDLQGRYTDNFIRTNKRFKAPINHIQECLGNKYSLQVSYYGRLLELKTGFKVKELKLFQIKPKTNAYRDVIEPLEVEHLWYDIIYYKREIDKIIEHHHDKIKNKINTQVTMQLSDSKPIPLTQEQINEFLKG